jgi:hypothetical protein
MTNLASVEKKLLELEKEFKMLLALIKKVEEKKTKEDFNEN